jgi:hypothetical protein
VGTFAASPPRWSRIVAAMSFSSTLYFEAEKEDGLRKVGYSKERRVDPQVVVGLLVDRHGFPLEIGCFAGNRAETTTIVPVIKGFQERHALAELVVVADAGMLSAGNLRELDEADLRFIVGSRTTKAPADLESHFRWHGDAFTDGQVIDTLTPKTARAARAVENDPKVKAEPVWDLNIFALAWWFSRWPLSWASAFARASFSRKSLSAAKPASTLSMSLFAMASANGQAVCERSKASTPGGGSSTTFHVGSDIPSDGKSTASTRV